MLHRILDTLVVAKNTILTRKNLVNFIDITLRSVMDYERESHIKINVFTNNKIIYKKTR